MLNQLTAFGVISFLNFLLTVILGSFAFRKGRKSDLKIAYAIFAYTLAFYAFFYFLWQSSTAMTWAVILFKWTIVGVVLINTSFCNFTYTLLNMHKDYKWHLCLVHMINLFFCYAALDLFYHDWKVKYAYGLWPVPSVVFHIYLIWWFLQVVWCFYLIWNKGIVGAVGKQKQQCEWVLASCFVGYIGGATNWFVWYEINFPPYLNVGVALYALILGYAVLRHRLLDVEVVIRKTFVFAGIVTAAVSLVAIPFVLIQVIIGKVLGVPNPFILIVLAVAATALIYRPVNRALVNITDKYLFQKKYDYQKVLKDATRGMAQIKSLNHLIRLVVHFITMKMRVKNAATLIRRRDNEYDLYGQRGYEKLFIEYRLDDTNPMISYLMLEKEAIEIEQIKEYEQGGNRKHAKRGTSREYDFQAIGLTMKSLEAACAVPSFLGRDLKSILLIGEKKSGEPFTSEDLNILFTLAQESAIAIENAKLYDEAVEKTKLLSKINQELVDTNEKLQVTHASLVVAEKNATMVGMAKAIGHEINNPLSSVILPIERIHRLQVPKCRDAFEKILAHISQEQREQTKESQEIVNKVLTDIQNATMRADRSANRISAVVHTLTDILKDSKGEMGSLSFLVLCREALDASRFSTSGLVGRNITQNIKSNLMIRGNVNQLLQVFINLVKNAFEAMDNQKDQTIIINGDYDPDNPEMALIEFIDNGPGIPPEVLPKIWMQGFSTKEKKDDSIGAAGQGQGLFVCKHVIESIHKGSLTAESALGKGTKFIIRLPLAELKENA